MITLPQLLEKTGKVVQAELADSGHLTSHFSALDVCGQITIFTLPTKGQNFDVAHLIGALQLMLAYDRHFRPAGMVLACGTDRPLIVGFNSAGPEEPSLLFAEAPPPELVSIFSPFLQVLNQRPKTAAERTEAKAVWRLIQDAVLPVYTHPSIGNN